MSPNDLWCIYFGIALFLFFFTDGTTFVDIVLWPVILFVSIFKRVIEVFMGKV